MRVFFNSGEIIEGHRAPVRRAIKRRMEDDPNLKYKFSGPFTELEEALYDLRDGHISWFYDNYDMETIREAIRIAELNPVHYYPKHMRLRGGRR